jgi:ABC-type lipoprotein export system ATPase subunit
MEKSAGPLLLLDNVIKSYHVGGGPEEQVLKGVSLEVGVGEAVAVTGPSGSGKTTLLNIIGTLDTATSGRLLFDGIDYKSLVEKEIREFRLNKVGFVFQEHQLLPQCSALENILLPTVPEMASVRNDAVERARKYLDAFGLSSKAGSRPGALSSGEKQRVAVIRALINRPHLILADEPTGALDRENAAALAEIFMRLNAEESLTIIMATHSQEISSKMKKIYRLVGGKLQSV